MSEPNDLRCLRHLRPTCPECHDAQLAENNRLRKENERLKKIEAAARSECAKFRFPDEDRPELWAALQETS